jgi:cytidylate kinase
MSVVTISGGWYRGGQIFAECLARRLGYRCIDREIIVEKAAAAVGAKEDVLRDALVEPPSLLDRLITHKKYVYLTELQAVLAEEVQNGRVIYHGYAGHLLLAGAGPVLRIRILGDRDLRLKTLQDQLDLTYEQAAAHTYKVDEQRKKWTRYLYDIDWEDPSLYDMVLNIGRLLQMSDTCDMVVSLIRGHPIFEMTEARYAELRDFALASRVRAELAHQAPYADSHVREVSAHDGRVHVEGTLEEAEEITDIERIVTTVPGVREVELRY